MSNEYTHRMDKLIEMQDICSDIRREGSHYSSLLIEKIDGEKKSLLSNLLYSINKESIFEDAIYLKSIGIKQFYETLKLQLKIIDEKQSFLTDFDIDKNKEEQFSVEKKLKEIDEKQQLFIKQFKEYPLELISIYKGLFGTKLIRDQEDILDLRNVSKIDKFFNKQKKIAHNSIEKYYEIYDNYNLLTEGTNLYNEYKEYTALESRKESCQREVFRARDHLKALIQEERIFNKDLEELKQLDNFDKIRHETIKAFVLFAHEIDNIDFYIEKIVIASNDKVNYKKMFQLKLQKEFFIKYLNIFNLIDDGLLLEVKKLQQEFKKIAFCKMEKITFPYFSNVGYFENRLLYYKKGKKDFFNLFNNKKIIKTENFEEFENNLSDIFNQKILKDFLALKEDFKIFEESELKVLDSQINHIIKSKSK